MSRSIVKSIAIVVPPSGAMCSKIFGRADQTSANAAPDSSSRRDGSVCYTSVVS